MTDKINRKIVVTGASSGIGKAIYDHYQDTPNVVIGISRHGPDMEIDLLHPFFTADDLRLLRDVELLVNAAGVMPLPEHKSFLKGIMEINFWGVVTMIRECQFVDKACVINIASVSAQRPDEDLPIYAASKAAVIAYTKAMAKQLAPNIRLNTISPGFYDTNLVDGDLPEELLETIPMGYEDDPKNLVPVVDMIWHNPYITGADFVIDGGTSI